MSQTRTTLVDLLKNIDVKLREQSQKDLADTGKRHRIFDTFPDLLDKTTIGKLLDRLNATLATNSKRKMTDNLNNWIITIVDIAIDQLLDNEGQIKQEICNALNWERDLTDTEVSDIVCAYVGHICQIILPQVSYPYPPEITCRNTATHINDVYPKAIDASLIKRGFLQEASDHTYRRPIDIILDNVTPNTVAAGGTLALLAIGGLALYTLFSKGNQQHSSETDINTISSYLKK